MRLYSDRLKAAVFLTAALAFSGTRPAWALTPEQTQAFVTSFNTDDAFGRLAAFDQFDRQVPAGERGAALHQLWAASAARPGVKMSVMAYLTSEKTAGTPLPEALKTDVTAAAKSSSPEMRRMALITFVKHKNPEGVKLFLTDPSDDLRQEALIATRDWPDHKAILESYMRANRRAAARQKSVAKAQFLLEKAK